MDDTYRVEPTSRDSALVHDIALSEGKLTRKVLRVTVVNNVHDPFSPLKACIIHQRRHSTKAPWLDVDSFDLRTLKAGEQVRMDLDCAETLGMFKQLKNLYQIATRGVPREPRNLAVVDTDDVYIATGKEREALQRLLQAEGSRFWDVINDLEPGVLEHMALAKIHSRRQKVVAEFEARLDEDQWSEGEWEKFFRTNKWIFGHNLSYRFLSELQGQPHYGGRDLTGAGGQRGDFLMASVAEARFTVLVDIKKPSSELVGKQYRNRAYELGRELVGGVSQLQSNCRTWAVEGSRQEQNRDLLESKGIYTFEPKGILVIGHTGQLDNRDKRATLELFRRNLHNPEILTYDEVLERARLTFAFHDESSDNTDEL